MALVMGIIKDELLEVREKYGDDRRTKIEPIEGEVDIEDLIQEEDMVVTLTRFGYIKRIGADTYRIQNRGGKGLAALPPGRRILWKRSLWPIPTPPSCSLPIPDGSSPSNAISCPLAGRTAKGSAIVNLLRLGPGEKITTVLPLSDSGKYLVMATRKGSHQKTPVEDFRNIRQNGLVAMGIREDDELCGVFLTSGRDDIILGTREGMSIRFHEEDVRPMGRSAMGFAPSN